MLARTLRLFFVCSLAGTSFAQGTSEHWYAARGNPSRTGATTHVPVRSAPVVAWSLEFDAVLSEPVGWGTHQFVVVQDSIQQNLLAIDTLTGEVVDDVSLGRGEGRTLAVWNGTVLVADGKQARTWTLEDGKLERGRTLRGKWRPHPLVHEGFAYLSDGEELHLVDLAKMKKLASSECGEGMPGLAVDGDRAYLRTGTLGEVERRSGVGLTVFSTRFSGLGERKPKGSTSTPDVHAKVSPRANSDEELYFAHYVGGSGQKDKGWFVFSPQPIQLQSRGRPRNGKFLEATNVLELSSSVAFHDGFAYGTNPDGELTAFENSDERFTGQDSQELPPGARATAPTIASGVLTMGNWALDCETKKVLWCVPDLETESPLLPIADGRLAAWTETRLVCYADPTLVDGSAAEASGPAASSGVSASRPGAGAAVVRADGARLTATDWERDADAVTLVGGAHDGTRVPLDAVAFLERDGELERLGDRYPLVVAWEHALLAEARAGMTTLFSEYERIRAAEDCQRLLDELLELGLSGEEEAELRGALVGLKQSRAGNFEAQRARVQADEDAARAKIQASFSEAAEWCADQDLTDCASALLAAGRGIVPPSEQAALIEPAKAWIPREFPWRKSPDAVKRWLRWNEAILPAEARFVAGDDPLLEGERSAPWDVPRITLRSPNLLLLTTEEDPEVIGKCLRAGEGTVRELRAILGDEGEIDDGPLEVRIHATRKEYLKEKTPDGMFALRWSAGYYAPGEGVSRFYVPREDDDEEREAAGDVRTLALDEIVSHELTHHYLDRRWIPAQSRSASLGGFWIVEGFATFVESQSPDYGRPRTGFDDPTVPALDGVAGAMEKDLLFETGEFLQLDQLEFHALGGEFLGGVQLRFSLGERFYDRRTLFYEQGGALVFFLLNHEDEAHRAGFLQLMRSYFEGEEVAEPWSVLGWESAFALDEEFRSFLGGVRDGSSNR